MAAARRLIERGARANLWQAAALGLLDRIKAELDAATPQDVTAAFWQACHGAQLEAAALLLERGADIDWLGWNDQTPLDIAEAQAAGAMVAWLRERGARSAAELGDTAS